MKKIKWYIGIGFAGCIHEGEWELDDEDCTEKILNESMQDELNNYIDYGYQIVEE